MSSTTKEDQIPELRLGSEVNNNSSYNIDGNHQVDINDGGSDSHDSLHNEEKDVVIDVESQSEVSPKRLDWIYRKIDMRIIPALWVLYFLTSYGTSAYGNSLTMNSSQGHSLPQKLNATSQNISTATTLNYVGFIVFDLPMNLVLYKISPHVWLSRIVITVGLVYTCIVGARNGAGIQAIRFFNGFVSAGVWPGMAYYISSWYPDHRSVSRVGYYFTAAQISAAVAGLLAAAFQKMDGVRGWTGYQWNFLIYGVITMFVGILIFFWLPNRPNGKKTFPLTDEEAEIHGRDIAKYAKRDQKFDWVVFKNVILDPRLLPLILMYFGVVGTGIGIQNYATTILRTYNPHWSSITLSLLTAPIWLFDLGGILTITPFADWFPQHRGIIFSFSTSIIICGLFVTTFAHGSWSKWGGLLICGYGLGSTVPITMSWGAGLFRKRHGDLGAACVTALVSGLGNLGSVVTTYALYRGWPEDAARMYRDSNMVMVAMLGISIIACMSLTGVRFLLGDFGEHSLVEITFMNWFRGRRGVIV